MTSPPRSGGALPGGRAQQRWVPSGPAPDTCPEAHPAPFLSSGRVVASALALPGSAWHGALSWCCGLWALKDLWLLQLQKHSRPGLGPVFLHQPLWGQGGSGCLAARQQPQASRSLAQPLPPSWRGLGRRAAGGLVHGRRRAGWAWRSSSSPRRGTRVEASCASLWLSPQQVWC